MDIHNMLSNEKYVGSCLFQKTYSDFRFNRHRNNGERAQFLMEEHHEAIISQKDFDAVADLAAQRAKEKNIKKCDARYQNRYPWAINNKRKHDTTASINNDRVEWVKCNF